MYDLVVNIYFSSPTNTQFIPNFSGKLTRKEQMLYGFLNALSAEDTMTVRLHIKVSPCQHAFGVKLV